jgi:DUF1365 family protein
MRTAPAPARPLPGGALDDAARSSAVYEGVVRHRRHTPHAHAFSYRMAQLYLDLDEIDRVFAGRWLWSAGRRNVAEFRRSDYLGPSGQPLSDAVRDHAARALGRRPEGPVRLLTHLRYAGYVFNPVSFYYCYAPDGETLECIIAEITNTPWRERQAYVLPIAGAARAGKLWTWDFAKTFHVSPFIPMNRRYDWRFSDPGRNLRVHMRVLNEESAEFDASLVLERKPLDSASLRRVLCQYPLMTLRVITAIHWQALRLWVKGNPVHTHPTTLTGHS